MSCSKLIYTWTIENLFFCNKTKGEFLETPKFQKYGCEWHLRLYPRGKRNNNFIAFYLHREKHANKESVPLRFHLYILDMDGKKAGWVCFEKCDFPPGYGIGSSTFMDFNELYMQRDKLVPNGDLTLQCQLDNPSSGLYPDMTEHILISTLIDVQRLILPWSFNHLEQWNGQDTLCRIRNAVETDNNEKYNMVCMYLYQKGEDIGVLLKFMGQGINAPFNGTADISVIGSDGMIKMSKKEQFLILGNYPVLYRFPPFINKGTLLRNKELYLPNGELTLLGDFQFALGVDICKNSEYVSIPSNVLSNFEGVLGHPGPKKESPHLSRSSSVLECPLTSNAAKISPRMAQTSKLDLSSTTNDDELVPKPIISIAELDIDNDAFFTRPGMSETPESGSKSPHSSCDNSQMLVADLEDKYNYLDSPSCMAEFNSSEILESVLHNGNSEEANFYFLDYISDSSGTEILLATDISESENLCEITRDGNCIPKALAEVGSTVIETSIIPTDRNEDMPEIQNHSTSTEDITDRIYENKVLDRVENVEVNTVNVITTEQNEDMPEVPKRSTSTEDITNNMLDDVENDDINTVDAFPSHQHEDKPEVQERSTYTPVSMSLPHVIQVSDPEPAHWLNVKFLICLILSSIVLFKPVSIQKKDQNPQSVSFSQMPVNDTNKVLAIMYAESLEDPLWSRITRAYSVADSYELFSIKNSSSDYIKSSLTVNNVWSALTLAEAHQDDDLKNAIEDFLLYNKKDTLQKEDWRKDVENRITLVGEKFLRRVWKSKGSSARMDVFLEEIGS